MADDAVAYLEVVLAGGGPHETQSDIEIRGNEQFFLGRNAAICRQSWPDGVISNKHLRIHCILYEQGPSQAIPPFVYATDLSTNGTYIKKANAKCLSSPGKGMRMGRDSTFLLDEGDELRLSDSVTLIYRSLVTARGVVLSAVQRREKELFSSQYVITGRLLGAGGYGKVMVAIHQDTQRQVACKVIDLQRLRSTMPAPTTEARRGSLARTSLDRKSASKRQWNKHIARYFREFDVLKDLSHPNIIAIQKVFWSSNTIYIFQELVTGGDLFSYVAYKGGRLNDMESAVIIRQLLIALQYLHSSDIVHRDLKPDNILMTSLDDGGRIVLTDFGHARYLPCDDNIQGVQSSTRRRMYSYAGTFEYAAPEIYRKNTSIPSLSGYSAAVDMWSVGIITGTLLSGRMLWAVQHSVRSETEFRTAVGALAAECDLGFLDDRQDRVWRNVGSKPKDFIRKLVVLEEKQRMTAHEALKHPWFTNSCHAAAFTSVYEKAIRNWRCHRPDMPLVEPLSQVSPELPKSATSGRFLTQEVISRHFAPPRGSSNSTLSSNQDAVQYPSGSQLPSMGEETGKQGLNSAQSVSAPCNDLRENIHLNQDDLNSYIDRLPVTRKYSNNGDVDPQGQLLVAKSSDNIYEGMDSIYQFSIPKPPPQVADDDEDSLLVPETPHSNAEKYRQQLPDCTPLREKKYGAGTTVKRTAQVYSAQKLSKRPKLCQ